MDLRQISVSFEQEQDRLLLRILGTTGSQTQVWLTRRLMLRLWPVLQQLVTQHSAFPAVSPQAILTPEARQMLTEEARGKAVRQADLSHPYREEEVSASPLGAEPLLAVQADLGALPGGRYRLGFRKADQQGFELELDGELMHVLMHLLERALRAAEWGVVPPEAEANAGPGQLVPATLLN